ncbi:MAG: hypothetical protein IT445_15595 [Phycisphaeraceae bacterium]|nr:hypothetical protein [Phycisphaeraceae bacterium]
MSALRTFSIALFAAAALALVASSAHAYSSYNFNYRSNDNCYSGGYQNNPYNFQHESFSNCFNFDFGHNYSNNSYCGGSTFDWNWRDYDCDDYTPDCGDWSDRGCWDWDRDHNDGNWPRCGGYDWPKCGDDKPQCHAVPSPVAAWAGMSLLGGLAAMRTLRRGRQEIEETF